MELEIEIDCIDLNNENCWLLREPPRVPPPPPLPGFLPLDIIGGGVNSPDGCDLCAWAYPSFSNSATAPFIPFTSLLAIVAISSALIGAALSAAVLSIKR
jgi:hypothetical protein